MEGLRMEQASIASDVRFKETIVESAYTEMYFREEVELTKSNRLSFVIIKKEQRKDELILVCRLLSDRKC